MIVLLQITLKNKENVLIGKSSSPSGLVVAHSQPAPSPVAVPPAQRGETRPSGAMGRPQRHWSHWSGPT